MPLYQKKLKIKARLIIHYFTAPTLQHHFNGNLLTSSKKAIVSTIALKFTLSNSKKAMHKQSRTGSANKWCNPRNNNPILPIAISLVLNR